MLKTLFADNQLFFLPSKGENTHVEVYSSTIIVTTYIPKLQTQSKFAHHKRTN